MRLPSYYCPNCKRFKHFWQVTNVDGWDYGNCKHCGTECVDVKDAILKLLQKTYEDKQYPQAPPTSGSNVVEEK